MQIKSDTLKFLGFIDVTPEMAQRWLSERNEDNYRNLNPVRLATYVRAIEEGRWETTHQGIGFDTNGDLADGQHRLTAIVRTGKTVNIAITIGLKPKAVVVIDVGAPRLVAETLNKHYGILNSVHVASAINVMRYMKNSDNTKLSPDEMYKNWYRPNRASLDWAAGAISTGKFRQAFIVGALAMAHKVIPESRRLELIEKLKTGENLSSGDALLVLRSYVLEEKFLKEDRRTQVTKTLTALMNFVQGTPCTKLFAKDEALDFFGQEIPEARA